MVNDACISVLKYLIFSHSSSSSHKLLFVHICCLYAVKLWIFLICSLLRQLRCSHRIYFVHLSPKQTLALSRYFVCTVPTTQVFNFQFTAAAYGATLSDTSSPTRLLSNSRSLNINPSTSLRGEFLYWFGKFVASFV